MALQAATRTCAAGDLPPGRSQPASRPNDGQLRYLVVRGALEHLLGQKKEGAKILFTSLSREGDRRLKKATAAAQTEVALPTRNGAVTPPKLARPAPMGGPKRNETPVIAPSPAIRCARWSGGTCSDWRESALWSQVRGPAGGAEHDLRNVGVGGRHAARDEAVECTSL